MYRSNGKISFDGGKEEDLEMSPDLIFIEKNKSNKGLWDMLNFDHKLLQIDRWGGDSMNAYHIWFIYLWQQKVHFISFVLRYIRRIVRGTAIMTIIIEFQNLPHLHSFIIHTWLEKRDLVVRSALTYNSYNH